MPKKNCHFFKLDPEIGGGGGGTSIGFLFGQTKNPVSPEIFSRVEGVSPLTPLMPPFLSTKVGNLVTLT